MERSGRRQALVSALAYLAIFAALAFPWLRVANDSIPRSRGTPFVYADDARFIVFVLGWAAHALATDPMHLYDAPIHYPAPRQLAGSEHFLGSQVIAAPVFWATGNAVLATNLVAFLSYPAAAVAADLLLLELGAGAGPAFVGGLLFALGPLRVPTNLQILQYLNVFLALVAWALTRLRARPSGGRAAVLCAVLVAGALSSYHTAAMVGAVGAAWGALELLRPLPGRARFAGRAAIAAAAALLVVALVSLPYFMRPEAGDAELLGTLGIRDRTSLTETMRWFVVLAPILFGPVALVLATAGLAILGARRSPVGRRLATGGLVLLLVGSILMLPPGIVRAAIDHSPLRFLRAPWRFAAIAGLGTALLGAALLQVVRERLPARTGSLAIGLVALVFLSTQGTRLAANGVDAIPALQADRALYESIGRAASTAPGGPGPLLELPMRQAKAEAERNDVPRGLTDPDAMVGITLHWLPLITGRTGYAPPHRRMIDEMIARLPARPALQELVDATGLRWLLLYPEAAWDDPAVRRGLLADPAVVAVLEERGFVLARVDLPAGRRDWREAIAHPDPRRRSPFGTPLEPLDPSAAAAEVLVDGLPGAAPAGSIVPIEVEVRNAGGAVWPVTSYVGSRLGVFIAAQWEPANKAAEAPTGQAFSLPRDLAPGERVRQTLYLRIPRAPGHYDVEILVKQWAGTRFAAPANRTLRAAIEVGPAAPGGKAPEPAPEAAGEEEMGEPRAPEGVPAGAGERSDAGGAGDAKAAAGPGATRRALRSASTKALAIRAWPRSLGWISSPSRPAPPAA